MSAIERGPPQRRGRKTNSRTSNTRIRLFQADQAIGGVTKRFLDAFLALLCLIGFLPMLILLAIAIKVSSPGPVLFGHTRVGHNGKSYPCLKFRTMKTNADALLESHLAGNPKARLEWEASRKLKDDPRVTALGRVLRVYSVDELPQLINVLRGEMSFVGPRPVVTDELDRYGPSVKAYLAARPGITGLWQTSGRSNTSYEYRVELDSRYVSEWSFWMDFTILLRTIPVVLGAKGSY